MLRPLITATIVALSGSIAASPQPNFRPFGHTLAPLHVPAPQHAHHAINNSYIVVLKPTAVVSDVLLVAQQAHVSHPLEFNHYGPDFAEFGVGHVFDSVALKGFAGRFSAAAVERLRAVHDVQYIEQDQLAHASDFSVDGLGSFEKDEFAYTSGLVAQSGAPWGLARISHRARGNTNEYVYDSRAGQGVDVYVLDTGVNIRHSEFQGRATWGTTTTQSRGNDDYHGHGTHCAGTVASARYGVAKAANIIAVKVLGDTGSSPWSDTIAGIQWVGQVSRQRGRPAVISMSINGGRSQAVDDIVNGVANSGVHFVVSAGNWNTDACANSPGAAQFAIKVGATDISDQRASFSNYGRCIDIWAPGVDVLSAAPGVQVGERLDSGTSMAAPHVAGVVAYFISLYGNINTQQMKQFLIQVGTKNVIGGLPGGTANVLLYNNNNNA